MVHLISILLVWTILWGLIPSVRTAGLTSLGLSSRLSVGDTLVSPSGRFELGIFAPAGGSRADLGYQLAIRYAELQHVVTWVANRDIPLSSNAYVYVSPYGNLQLFDPINNPNKPSWTSNAAANYAFGAAWSRASTAAGQRESCARDQNQKVQWDSFVNSPSTDTLLPGQYLLRAANLNMSSWKASDNPATGLYSFGWGGLNMSVLQLTWTSPKQFMTWTGGAYIPAPDVHTPHTITGVSSVYFHPTFGHLYATSSPADTVLLSGSDPVAANTMKRITIDTDGGLRIWQWNIGTSKSWTAVANWVLVERPESRSQCTVMGTCGPYGWCISAKASVDKVQCKCPNGFKPINEEDITRGCLPVVPLVGSDCNDTATVMMEELAGVDMPWGGGYQNLTGANSSRCKEKCLSVCECAGRCILPRSSFAG
ncbi:G-type lectin S-receptor-like serine/threonine-protein kinase At1g11280 isoform X3 [Physcomitrium patens]|uniref:G-type lectin S-receptor-like serine/threonine-protein kinase At1g11280 isoform X3 n=1 Tax=Physcomitrium patens TaxID=3218 RepID=UPI000D170EEB|nr:G-type lectin S-receptor-like serine/threonine-protein kinase At4g03230 isoform X2 [Physcomitrium patens]XP_024363615.1 G-type lectin S-receptor-like serine/threonine-protein kinase At4g03230 isoform X2 [Physcomitrium patens]XP_024363616.1 G-type lectin S-receptor-like serine/threonine-protein kinase At4g03230 isoform X2 [Physcomitrium patens]XP_024363617.1 G-type lectin S-receptor-like serine/threonine-protein kinase At4g03230 isoform X2 [Physcomitrium patens]XP_024363618.1 G-type lectin S-|eukprot:XP_024363614.1 G-type lectin S-receptor-like serine/threonine-protein kinase At4g03230 isoform X2 [Physcomitrella patens]